MTTAVQTEGGDLRHSAGAEEGAALPQAQLDSQLQQDAVAARAGDEIAFHRLMDRVHDCAFRYARASAPVAADPAVADRAAQAVCDLLEHALPSYDENVLPVDAVVYGLCAHVVAGLSREDAVTPEGDAAFVAQLPAHQRELLTLRLAVGLSVEETGRSLGMSPNSVRVAQHRALERVRRVSMQEGEGR